MKTLAVTITEAEYDQLGIETDTLDFSHLVDILNNEEEQHIMDNCVSLAENQVYARNNWLNHAFTLMDKAHGSSGGKKWVREDLYRG
jgi:hypothetical protein